MSAPGERRTAVVFLALLLSAAVFSLPDMVNLTRRALSVAGMEHDVRRAHVLGEFYVSLRALDEALPAGTDVAILMNQLSDVDRGVFVNYYAYPRRTRFYYGLDQYRHDESPSRPGTLWYVDLDRTHRVRQMSYEEIRVEQSERDEPVAPADPLVPVSGEVIVPLVATVDGTGRDRYVTEAAFTSPAVTRVHLELMPGGAPCTLDVGPESPTRISDLMSRCFGRMGSGWARLSAEGPVEAGFWLVNRGAMVAAPLRLFDKPPPGPIVLSGGERVWIVNPHAEPIGVEINGNRVDLGAGALAAIPVAAGGTRVESRVPVIAFASRKEADGNTTFFWPEDVK
jgi:hypothetical protein